MPKAKTVSAYIAAAAPKTRPKLKQLRAAIKTAVPKAEEKISYGMPYYGYHGRLIYFAGFKHHIGVYIMSDARKAHTKAIAPYHQAMATLHFALDAPLPVGLIKKLTKTQARANALRKKDKKAYGKS
jgi:uncharacterized protein YdhG (YjbR/CyaY superfamily)